MAAKHSPRFEQLCEAARARITELAAPDLIAQQASPTPLHLIDVREDHEWQLGHLPGAEHLGKGILERDIERRFPALDTELVLYCGGGYRSALATQSLMQMGYTRVRSLAGGFRGWQEAGRPVVNDGVGGVNAVDSGSSGSVGSTSSAQPVGSPDPAARS